MTANPSYSTNKSMKLYRLVFLLALFPACLFAGKTKISLEQVPEYILDAAEKEVDDIKFKEAEIFFKRGVMVYELDGEKGSKEYEIHVDASGRVLKVEKEKK